MGAMEMSGPFWPLHLRTLEQMSDFRFAWVSMAVYAGPMVMALCSTPWWGRMGDRIGHKPMVVRALLALAATQIIAAFAPSVIVVLIARLAQGALGGFIAAAQAYGAGLVDRPGRGSLMARLQVATALGSAFGPGLGGLLFDGWGFQVVNLVAAVVCVGCAVAAIAVLPRDKPALAAEPRPSGATTGPAGALVWGALRGLLIGIVLVQTGKLMPQAFFAVFAQQVLQADAAYTGLCYGATALGLCVAAPMWGRWFEAMDQAAVMRRVEWIALACAATVAMQAWFVDLRIFLLARLLWGVCLGALLPVFYALLSLQASARQQGAVLGWGNSAAKAGALLGTASGALTMAWLPLKHVFWPACAIYAVAALGLRMLRLKTPRQLTGAAP
ncbi:MFS transporter [Ottowia testudinis]|uniref:MFS transporter n=2 Tax=Ottowia testudinis TaxID=2816950 RepID=A0A975H4V8_9BURK|nr:MFS transporter [Ottowia testudinis]